MSSSSGWRARLLVLGHVVRGLVALLALAAVLGGVPWLLWQLIGWPLPDHVPSVGEVSAVLTQPMSDDFLANAVICLAWLLWATFTVQTVMALPGAVSLLRQGADTQRNARGSLARTGSRSEVSWDTGHVVGLLPGRGLGQVAAALLAMVILAVLSVRSPTHQVTLTTVTTVATTSATFTLADALPGGASGAARPAQGTHPNPGSDDATGLGGAGSRSPHAGSGESGTGGEQAGEHPGHRSIVVARPHGHTHDSLWRIADKELGNPRRWTEIYHLNVGREQPDGQHLIDPDLIQPGWVLVLPTTPTHAAPKVTSPRPSPPAHRSDPGSSRPHHQPTTPEPTSDAGDTPTQPARPGNTTPRESAPAATIEAPTATSSQTLAVPAPPTTAPPTTAPVTTAPVTTAPVTTSAPTPAGTSAHQAPSQEAPAQAPGSQSPSSPAPDADRQAARSRDSGGVEIDGGWIPWSLASGVGAAIALVWLQRRRRHTPTSTDDDPTDLPYPLLDIKQHLAGTSLPIPLDLAERAASVPAAEVIPPGGLGLVGEGAQAAARAALAAALAAGGPQDPDRQAEVVIAGGTLGTLIGVEAAALGRWPRLHVADDPDHALGMIEARLLHRARILDEHTASDLDTLRALAPSEEPLPPVLLITEAPPADARMRAHAALTLGAALDITALLLGPWTETATVDVDADGSTRRPSGPQPRPGSLPAGGPPTTTFTSGPDPQIASGADSGTRSGADSQPGLSGTVGGRMGVLEPDATVAILAALREAHTGRRPAITVPTRPPRPAPPAESTDHPDHPDQLDQLDQLDQVEDTEHVDGDATSHGPADGLSPGTDLSESGPARRGSGDPSESNSALMPPADPEPGPLSTPLTGKTQTSEKAGARTAGPRSAAKATLRVFGSPRIEDLVEPGQPLRSKAAELAVFLACHREGADTRGIGDVLESDVRLRAADTRVHTNVSNLRHVLGRAAGFRRIGYVIKNGGRYQLDRSSVEVDLWQHEELLAAAAVAASGERIRLLRQACDLYTAPLAEGCDYDWVEPHRERARQHAGDAHRLLAEALMPTDPQAASDVLDRAIGLDRYNEGLYRAAMHARHRLGDRDGIRSLLRGLTTALGDLDAEPDEETLELARHLRTQPAPTRPAGPAADGPAPQRDPRFERDEGITTPATVATILATLALLAILVVAAAGAGLTIGRTGIADAWRAGAHPAVLAGALLVLAASLALTVAWSVQGRRRAANGPRSARWSQNPSGVGGASDRDHVDDEPEVLTDPPREQAQSRRLSVWARVVLIPVAAIGAVLSFRSLYQAAQPTFGPYLAVGFPALVDLLILGSSLQYVAGAKVGRPMTGWRVTAHAGVAATLLLNALAADHAGQVPWHVTAPAVWAVLVELTARQVLGQWKATHAARLDSIPLSLWLTAPIESGRTRLLMLRTGISDARAARIAVGTNAAAREVVRLTLATRHDRRTRKVIYRQLRAGSLTPTAILTPLGWDHGQPLLASDRPNIHLLAAVLRGVLTPDTPVGTAGRTGPTGTDAQAVTEPAGLAAAGAGSLEDLRAAAAEAAADFSSSAAGPPDAGHDNSRDEVSMGATPPLPPTPHNTAGGNQEHRAGDDVKASWAGQHPQPPPTERDADEPPHPSNAPNDPTYQEVTDAGDLRDAPSPRAAGATDRPKQAGAVRVEGSDPMTDGGPTGAPAADRHDNVGDDTDMNTQAATGTDSQEGDSAVSIDGRDGEQAGSVDERRLVAAMLIVQRKPAINGQELAAALTKSGWPISARTARRLLQQIQASPNPAAGSRRLSSVKS